MKLRATITMDTEVASLRGAATWEDRIEKLAAELSTKGHENVTYDVKERRDRAAKEEIPRYRKVVNG